MDFTHFQAGTDERRWADSPRLVGAPALVVPTGVQLVVLVAHPDDETLGAGGLIRAVARAGGHVRVIVATAGEHSHPDSATWTPARLARARSEELPLALARLADGIELHLLGYEDGCAADHEDLIHAAAARLLTSCVQEKDAPVWVATPWRHDAHPDHEAVARVALRIASELGATMLEMPIWFWHWGDDSQPVMDWSALRRLELDPDAVLAKAAAMAEHVTQVQPLSPAPGDETILPEPMLAHFRRPYEVFVVSTP